MNNKNKYYNKIPYYIIFVLLLFLVYQSVNSNKPVLTIVLANTVIILGLIPFYFYVKKNNFNKIPILELQGVFYSLTFGYVALQDFTRQRFITDNEINITLIYMIIGLLMMYFGYYILARKLFNKKIKSISFRKIRLKIYDLKNFALFYSGIFILYNLFIPAKLESINTYISLISIFSKGILFYLFIEGKVSFNEKILITALILFDIITGLTAGVLASFSSLMVFIGIIYIHFKRNIPYYMGLLVIVFFVLMQTIKVQYRDIVWWGGGQNYSTLQKLEILYDLTRTYYSNPTNAIYQAQDAAYNRIDHLGTTALVISSTPNPVNYKYGLTYYPIFTKFIPRIIWKNKPEENIGNVWAKWYGLLNFNDFKTSYNLPWFTELYINFGPWGIIFGMMFFGLFLKLIVILFDGSINKLVFIVGVALTYEFYGPESHFSLKAGNLLLGFIAIYYTLKFINYLKFKK